MLMYACKEASRNVSISVNEFICGLHMFME